MDGKKWIGHYNSGQKILLVGEGNFSFAASLAKSFGSATNMVATCLHSKDVLVMMHLSSIEHLRELEERGCQVLHEVDVRTMNSHHLLKYIKFDIILYNFPHAGHFPGIGEANTYLIGLHQDLIKAYFKSSKEMLKPGGEVHVTHRDDSPYNRWEIERLAKENGLVLKEKVGFNQWTYPGYSSKRGSTSRCDSEFPLKECFTFKFITLC